MRFGLWGGGDESQLARSSEVTESHGSSELPTSVISKEEHGLVRPNRCEIARVRRCLNLALNAFRHQRQKPQAR